MSRTKRRNWFGKAISDGDHGKRCPEPNCNYCMTGSYKKEARRKERRKKIDRD